MYRFFRAKPIKKPEDVIPHLGKGEKHWKKGRSAYELTHSWLGSDGIPERVKAVLDQAEAYRGATLLEGFFEHNTPLRTPGRDSQTDLLALVQLRTGLGVIGVEGKVDEPFGPLVKDWLDDSNGKARRLASLLELLGVGESQALSLRYQLFHRTASAIYEAQRYGADHAMMLVHSFSPTHACFEDLQAFATALGAPVDAPSSISPEIRRGGVSLTLGWVADKPM